MREVFGAASSFVLFLSACGTPSSGTTTTVCADDEIGETIGGESGGTEGCLFVPYCAEDEDDGSTDKLDLGVFPDLGCDPDCPPPPGSDPPDPPYANWDYHSATDTYYRYASESELEEHGWVAGTILISAETAVAGLTNGSNTLAFGLPIGSPTGAINVKSIVFAKAQTRNDTWYLNVEDTSAGSVAHAFRPDFHLFLPSWVDFEELRRPTGTDVFVWAYGDSHGGVAMQGMTADQEFSILGPTTEIWLETLPPDHAGVLVATPSYRTTDFDDVLDHWIDVLSTFCDTNDCDLDPNVPVDPGNCGDCIDNDQDTVVDGNDLFCKHRTDFGCDGFGDHNHRWENSKDFATMPDIGWCTAMAVDGMPWHADVNMKASTAAAMLNAIPMALAWMHDQGLEQSVEVPEDLPTIRHRMAYCVFVDDVESALACIDDPEECPPFYQLGGVSQTLPAYNDAESDIYFEKLWAEFDQAAATLEVEGITPKPVAMLASVYSGDLVDGIDLVIGYAGSIGGLEWTVPSRLGATIVEAQQFVYPNMAHEFGHALGFSHTLDNGAPVNLGGFMQQGAPFPVLSLLGPSEDSSAGYGGSSQWTNWAIRIGDKTVPRPNAFGWVGCNDDNDCPSQLDCWFFGANTPGVCRNPL